jgi:hydroxymethylbilane synthase
VLAAAGVERLNWSDKIGQYLDDSVCLHAVGQVRWCCVDGYQPDLTLDCMRQGSIAIECRADDSATLALIQPLNHTETALYDGKTHSAESHLSEGLQALRG